MLRISFVKINSSQRNIFPVLEFLNFLAIRELSFLLAVSYKESTRVHETVLLLLEDSMLFSVLHCTYSTPKNASKDFVWKREVPPWVPELALTSGVENSTFDSGSQVIYC